MRTLRPITILATTAVVGLALTGCSVVTGLFGGGEDKLSESDSPLAEYLSVLYDGDVSPEDLQSEADAQQVQMEEAIAACMQAEGFEYIPDVGTGSGVSFSVGEDWNPDDKAWVEKYGYGIFSWPGMDDEPSEEDFEEYVNPNQEYIDSLSESERTAYEEALSGEQPSVEQMEDPEFDWSNLDGGCQTDAMNEVYNNDAVNELYEQYEPLLNSMSELYSDALEIDAVVELDAKWASCMADAGYPDYTTQPEAQEKISEKQSEIYENAYGDEPDWENATEEEINAYYDSSDPMKSDEWAEAADEEIKTALADLECRDKTDYSDKALEARFELEKQFIEDNKTELEAFRAAAEQAL